MEVSEIIIEENGYILNPGLIQLMLRGCEITPNYLQIVEMRQIITADEGDLKSLKRFSAQLTKKQKQKSPVKMYVIDKW